VRSPDGGFEMNYDRAIAQPYQKAFLEAKEISLWPMYDAIRCPTLVLRGVQSDILPHETAVEMTTPGPRRRSSRCRGGPCADVPR
jgi:pimeloyl-ACP methyl ester carboxylesterase